MRILLSRTDSIGDVVLTLPMAGLIKKAMPQAEVQFLGRNYTRSVVACSEHIDRFRNWDELEKLEDKIVVQEIKDWKVDVWIHVFPVKEIAVLVRKAGIGVRIGTSGRFYHLFNCNKLVRFSRRRSDLHESQLNLTLLKPLGISDIVRLDEVSSYAAFNKIPALKDEVSVLLKKDKVRIILHPKSKGSAVEWGLENFAELIQLLNDDGYQLIVTGTKDDEKAIGSKLPFNNSNVLNLLGRLSLDDLISLISQCDALVAASTGPLHLAGIMNIRAIGLFSPRRPIHPGRWSPIGEKSTSLVSDEDCQNCKKGKDCECIKEISAKHLASLFDN